MISGTDLMVSPVERRLGRIRNKHCDVINIENVNGVELLKSLIVAFSGADVVVSLDGVPESEVLEIDYQEDVFTGRVMGYMRTTVSHADREVRKRMMAARTVLVTFANEQGQRYTEELTGLEIHTISRKRDLRENLVTTTYEFIAEFMEEGVPA